MTVSEVKATLQAELGPPNYPILSILMPAYGIKQTKEEAIIPPKLETLFTSNELEHMCDHRDYLDAAVSAIREYRDQYYWDGYLIDARCAYVCAMHDFEGTRCWFHFFWIGRKNILEEAKRAKEEK